MPHEIPQHVKKATEGYVIVLYDERELKIKKERFGRVLKAFIENVRKSDPDFTTFSTKHGDVTYVEPLNDQIDAEALWEDLRSSNLLTPEIKMAFSRTVDKSALLRFIDELKIPRKIVKKHWKEVPGTPYIRVTPKEG